MSSQYDSTADDQYYKETYQSSSGLHPKVEAAYRQAKFEPQITPKQAIKMKFDEQYAENPALAARIRKRINAIWRFFTPTVDDFVIFEVTDIASDFVGNESYRTYKVGFYDMPSFQYVKDQMSGKPTSVKVSRKQREYEIKYSPEAIEEILNSGDSSQAKLYIHDGRFTYMIYNLDDFINLPGEQLIDSIYAQRSNANARGDDRMAGVEGKLIQGDALEKGAAMAEPHTRRSRGVAGRRASVTRTSTYVEKITPQTDFERDYTESTTNLQGRAVNPDEIFATTVEHDADSYANAQAILKARLQTARAKAIQEAKNKPAERIVSEQGEGEEEEAAAMQVQDAQQPTRKPKIQTRNTRGNKAKQGKKSKMAQEENNNQQQGNEGQQLSKGPNAKMTIKETVYSEVKPENQGNTNSENKKQE